MRCACISSEAMAGIGPDLRTVAIRLQLCTEYAIDEHPRQALGSPHDEEARVSVAYVLVCAAVLSDNGRLLPCLN